MFMPDKRNSGFYGSDFGVNPNNPHGLQLKFDSHPHGQWLKVSCQTTVANHFEGPPGHVHGGITFSILDEAMGRVSHINGYKSLSVTMTIDWHLPTPLNTLLTVDADLTRADGDKIYTQGQIALPDGRIAVSATGIYVARPELFKKFLNKRAASD